MSQSPTKAASATPPVKEEEEDPTPEVQEKMNLDNYTKMYADALSQTTKRREMIALDLEYKAIKNTAL